MPPLVGVKRQYCGQMGKQENCRIAVSVSMAAEQARKEINSWPGILPLIEWLLRKGSDKPFLPCAGQQCRHRVTRRGHKQHDWKPCTESQEGG